MSNVTITSNEKPENNEDKAFLEMAFERFRRSSEATTEIRKDALDDLKFAAGEQWPDEIKRDRDQDKRPCLTINRLPQFIRQVTNDLRQNRPSITVSPVGDQGDIETAEIIQGIMRHIEYNSHADIAYDTASTAAARQSFGYFRIVTEYVDDDTFEQEIKIKRIRNPFTVYFDPSCQEPDYSDATYCFIVVDMPKEEYKKEYPNSQMASLADFKSIGDKQMEWVQKDTIRVAEYYYIERKPVKLVRLSNKQTVLESTLTKKKDGMYDLPEGVLVMDKRDSYIKSVKWVKMNAVEKLDETDVWGKYIPVIPVLGEEYDIDGKLKLESCIRHAKDPQRMYNFWASAETEMIALAPKAPWVGAEGQFEEHEEEWRSSNNRAVATLEYKPVTIGDKPAPPPSRNTYEPPVQAITQARAQSADDLKATIGIYDPALGAMGNETSGRAILARQQQSHTSVFHYSDNFARALKHAGLIILGWFPYVYDEPRVMRIISDSGAHGSARINQSFMEDGVKKIYDVTIGRYDVIIETGPSYNTKRQEAAASMQEVVSAWPQLMQYAGDLLVRNFDWPGASELAERLHKMLPPALQDNDNSDIPPQVKMQMDQQSKLIQALTQELNKMSQKIETKTEKIQSDERIALMRVQADLIKLMATIDSEEARHAFELEIGHIDTLLKLQGEEDPAGAAQQSASVVEKPGTQGA